MKTLAYYNIALGTYLLYTSFTLARSTDTAVMITLTLASLIMAAPLIAFGVLYLKTLPKKTPEHYLQNIEKAKDKKIKTPNKFKGRF